MEPLPFVRLLFCLTLILGVWQDGVEAQSKPCTLPNGNTPGTCVAIERCRNIYNIVRNPTPNTQKYDPYIKKAACTLPGVERSICCSPREVVPERFSTATPRARMCNKRDLLPKDCGKMASDRIFGGNVTKVFEYPWMAVLQYNENGDIVGGCGGTLITERYVLTAAHCIKTRSNLQLHNVILGEHTKNQMIDCNVARDNNGNILGEDCADPVEEFGIESVKIHEDYTRKRNDIGLIRLDRDVTMKDHIKPICLPISDELRTQSFNKYIVTGWGRTENSTGSDVLMQANLNHVDIEKCQQIMTKRRTNVVLSDKQICAQGKGLVDACKGDSGGPLVFTASYPSGGARFVQLGIVSFGLDCGQKSTPGVYCRVASYIDWILDNMQCGA